MGGLTFLKSFEAELFEESDKTAVLIATSEAELKQKLLLLKINLKRDQKELKRFYKDQKRALTYRKMFIPRNLKFLNKRIRMW